MKLIESLFLLVFFVFITALSQNVFAATVTPVSASSATIAYPAASNSIYVLDGIINYDQLLYIGNEGFDSWDGDYTVTFDLGGSYDLTSLYLWNNGGDIENDGEGIKDFELIFSDAVGVIGSFLGGYADDILAQQTFDIGTRSNVTSIDLKIFSNHTVLGNYTVDDPNRERGYAAFYEINFEGSPSQSASVPVPSTITLLGLGLFGLAGVSRRKK